MVCIESITTMSGFDWDMLATIASIDVSVRSDMEASLIPSLLPRR